MQSPDFVDRSAGAPAPEFGKRMTLGRMLELAANLQPVFKCKPANIPAFRFNAHAVLPMTPTHRMSALEVRAGLALASVFGLRLF